MTPPLDVPIVLSEPATCPTYKSSGAAGADLYAADTVELLPLERKLVPTGVRMAIPNGYEAQVRPRSGLALRLGVGMVNAPGTIDSDFRGEIAVLLINLSDRPVRLERGERIAQLVIARVERANWIQATELDDTGRGVGGFGSTGER